MKSKNDIITEIFKDLIFTDKETQLIASVLHKIKVKKGTILLNTGDAAETQYFIFSGCLRTYYIDPKGKEHTLQFGIKDWWICHYTTLFTSGKSTIILEVIQDATLYKIKNKDKDLLYQSIPQIESFFRIKVERALGAFQKRILGNLSETATERYLSFVETYPDIEKNIKNYHIASYLGITTESLSRIRKKLAQ